VKFGCLVFELCDRTDRQSQKERQTYSSQYFASLPGGWSNEVYLLVWCIQRIGTKSSVTVVCLWALLP